MRTRAVRIVCTVGPASRSNETLLGLIEELLDYQRALHAVPLTGVGFDLPFSTTESSISAFLHSENDGLRSNPI
ncbi:MAG: hypothetical protein HC788_04445 [Sphingopyxis sp.]|nr:hypothetical protein [Sphingopyxis sp.]